jgi:hypothetical protein
VYTSLPPFGWYISLPLATLAIAELLIARRVRAAVRHNRDAKPVTALAIARSVALAKASILVGAGMAGAAAGLVVHVLPDIADLTDYRHDLWVGLLVMVASAALTAAAYLLERSAVDPGQRSPHAER